MTRDEALTKPAATKVEVPCFACGESICTSVRYLRKKTAESTLCLSCINRSRSLETRAKIAAGVSKANSTMDAKKRISESVRGRIDEGWRPIRHRPDPKILSEKSAALWRDDGYRERQAAGANAVRTDEWKERMSDVQREVWQSPDLCERNRESSRKLWLVAEFRSNQLAKRATPEHRERQAENTRVRWLDPLFRERMSELAAKRWEDQDYRTAVLSRRLAGPLPSVLNATVDKVLTDLGVEHELEKQVGPYRFDVFVPSHNLLIELNGEYWHSLPRAIRNDKSKATYIERFHPELKLAVIWEIEFSKERRLLYLLRRLLGLERVSKSVWEQKALFAWDDLSIVESDKRTAGGFYGAYHYIGSARGGTHFACQYKGEAIAFATFSPFQRKEQSSKYSGAVELSRFCIHPEFNTKNLGSWFLSRCLKLVGKMVVTYADTTAGHDGALYKACNFKFSHEVEPDYWWIDCDGWASHKRTIWGRASKMKMSEADYAKLHGLSKRWGGKKLCFIYSSGKCWVSAKSVSSICHPPRAGQSRLPGGWTRHRLVFTVCHDRWCAAR